MKSSKERASLTISVLCLFNLAKVAVTTTARITTASSTQVCADKLPDCYVYGLSACSGVYEVWARLNCAATCGFCLPVTTPPPPCTNYLDNCESYGTTTCETAEFVGWAQTNCRAYCRFCTAEQLAELDARKTTLPPELCFDKVDCTSYGEYICKDAAYASWAVSNCPLYCSYCAGIPTPPKPCVDIQPDCPLYGTDVCTNPDYTSWVKDHCPKFCGLCVVKTSTAPSSSTTKTTQSTTMRVPPLISTTQRISTPPHISTTKRISTTPLISTTQRISTPPHISTTQRISTTPHISTTQRISTTQQRIKTPPLPSAPPLKSKPTGILIPTHGK